LFFGFVEIESKEGRKTVYSRHKTASTNDGLPEILKKKYRNRISSGHCKAKKKMCVFMVTCQKNLGSVDIKKKLKKIHYWQNRK
jgi:hypothetical protein